MYGSTSQIDSKTEPRTLCRKTYPFSSLSLICEPLNLCPVTLSVLDGETSTEMLTALDKSRLHKHQYERHDGNK